MQAIKLLQQAICAAILASDIHDLINGVYNFIPSDAVFPYIKIGESSLTSKLAHNDELMEVEMKLCAVDSGGSNLKILDIADGLHNLFASGNFSMNTYEVITCSFTSCDVLYNAKIGIWEAVSTVKFLLRTTIIS